jgi:hypothetical protein
VQLTQQWLIMVIIVTSAAASQDVYQRSGVGITSNPMLHVAGADAAACCQLQHVASEWWPCTITSLSCIPREYILLCCRAAGWSTLTPDDAEVVVNMQSYVRSLLQPTASGQPSDNQQSDHGSAPDSRGWSLPQQALVSICTEYALQAAQRSAPLVHEPL